MRGKTGQFFLFSILLLVSGCAYQSKVSFYSEPERASVVLSNEQGAIGETPLEDYTVKFSSPDEVIVADAKKEHFVPARENIYYQRTHKVVFKLKPKEKILHIESNVRGTKVYINSELIGTCGPGIETTIKLPVVDKGGNLLSYVIRGEKEGWGGVEKKIGPGEELIPSRIKFVLQPEIKRVIVKSNIDGVKIIVDGKETGEATPCELLLNFIDGATGELKTIKIEGYKEGYEGKDGSSKVVTLLKYFKENEKEVVLPDLKKREEIYVPSVEFIVLPANRSTTSTGTILGFKWSRAMLSPVEDSPNVSSCTRITSFEVLPEEISELAKIKEAVSQTGKLERKEILENLIYKIAKEPTTKREIELQRKIRKLFGNISSLTLSPDGNTIVFSQTLPLLLPIEKETQSSMPSFSDVKLPIVYGMYSLNPNPVVLKKDIKKELIFSSCLRAIKTTGGGITTITESAYIDKDPSFTPDGKYIYFCSNRGGNDFAIWRIGYGMPLGLTRITSGMFRTEDVRVSPSLNANKIAYASLAPTAGIFELQIWTATLQGALQTQFRYGRWPDWSPDGKKIVFSSRDRRTGNYKIWMMDADGTNWTQLTFGDGNDIQPKFSPDGKYIAFASNVGVDYRKVHNYDIWVMRVDGSMKTQLTTNGSEDRNPIWAPDGKTIYFVSNRGGTWNIWSIGVKNLP